MQVIKWLKPENAYIFRIVHLENVQWMLGNGIHCQNSAIKDPNYREIGNPDLIAKRDLKRIPIQPAGLLSDYIPFYFTPYTPMLYNIKTGIGVPQVPNSEIAILFTSLHKLIELGVQFLFTDCHAYLQMAEFFSNLEDLHKLDWERWQTRNFKRSSDDFGFERYQAEALIYRHLPVTALWGIICYNDEQTLRLRREVQEQGLTVKIIMKPDWYF